MFYGEYKTVVGDKNRIAIPKKIRSMLLGQTIVTRGYDKCLLLVDKSRWQALVNEINKSDLLKENTRNLKRYLIGGTQEIEPDSQGRFVLSDELKRFAQINEQAVFIGVGEWVEIWDEDKWAQKIEDLVDTVSDISNKL